MTAKKLALTRRAQYLAVYKSGKALVSDLVVIKVLPNNLLITRTGFSVTKEIGKAVVRNHIKRWLKEIVRQLSIKKGWDIVFIARNEITRTSFDRLKKNIIEVFSRKGLLDINGKENCPQID